MVAGSILIPSLTTMRDWIIIFTSLIAPALLLPTIWGLYSRKITQSAVWWCVVANVIASLVVRFGLRSEGWFGGVDALTPLVQLIESNMRVSDIMVGIIAPILVLSLMELRARKEADGWHRLEEAMLKNQREEIPTVVDSRGPVSVIVWCLGFLSVIMLIISIITPEERKVLITATCMMLVMTVVFFLLLKKTKMPPTSLDTESAKTETNT